MSLRSSFWVNQGSGGFNIPPGNWGLFLLRGRPAVGCPNTGAVYRVTASDFVPIPGIITFNEFSLGTTDPVYPAAAYGGSIDVLFGGCIFGQSNSFINTGFYDGVPDSPIVAIDSAGSFFNSTILNDPDRPGPDQRVLAGDLSVTAIRPISMIFETDVVGVSFSLGGFNTFPGCVVTLYDRSANVLGTWQNTGPDVFEMFYFNSDSDTGNIAAVTIETLATETNGIALKNVQFTDQCYSP